MNREPFTLSGHFAGPDVSQSLVPHFRAIKRQFARITSAGFGPGLSEIAFILRGDGSVRSFDLDGYGYFIVDKKDKSISIDIGVPVSRWKGVPQREVARFLAESMINSIPDAARELRSKGLSLDVDTVSRSLRDALGNYEAEVAEE